jgi:hypothetical protein
VQVFLWLVLHDHRWTGERRKRHNLQEDDSSTFCDQQAETITHLLIGCVFAREVWALLLYLASWQSITPRAAVHLLAVVGFNRTAKDSWGRTEKRRQDREQRND